MPSGERERPVPTREEVIAVVQAWRREHKPEMGPGGDVPDCGYCVERLAVNVGLMEENRQLKKRIADGAAAPPAPASAVPAGDGDPDLDASQISWLLKLIETARTLMLIVSDENDVERTLLDLATLDRPATAAVPAGGDGLAELLAREPNFMERLAVESCGLRFRVSEYAVVRDGVVDLVHVEWSGARGGVKAETNLDRRAAEHYFRELGELLGYFPSRPARLSSTPEGGADGDGD